MQCTELSAQLWKQIEDLVAVQQMSTLKHTHICEEPKRASILVPWPKKCSEFPTEKLHKLGVMCASVRLRAGEKSMCGCLLCNGSRDKSICMELEVVVRLKKDVWKRHGRSISRQAEELKCCEKSNMPELIHQQWYTICYNVSRKCTVFY